jgi:hypothetical protein
VLSAPVSDFMVCDGGHPLAVYHEVGPIPEELLLGLGQVFPI